jgi:hypothetical protein
MSSLETKDVAFVYRQFRNVGVVVILIELAFFVEDIGTASMLVVDG